MLLISTLILPDVHLFPLKENFTINRDSWWYRPCDNTQYVQNPCSHHNRAKSSGQTQVVRSPDAATRHLVRVRQDLRKVIAMTNRAVSDLSDKHLTNAGQIYDLVLNQIEKDQFRQFWLPKPRFKQFKIEPKTNRKQSLRKWLPKIHKEIQIYAITFEILRYRVQIETNVSCQMIIQQRSEILDSIITLMRTLLCELEHALDDLCLSKRIERVYSIENFEIEILSSLTNILVQDWGVISNYSDSLIDWMKIFKQLRKMHVVNKDQRSLMKKNQRSMKKLKGKKKRKNKKKKKNKNKRLQSVIEIKNLGSNSY